MWLGWPRYEQAGRPLLNRWHAAASHFTLHPTALHRTTRWSNRCQPSYIGQDRWQQEPVSAKALPPAPHLGPSRQEQQKPT